MQPDRVDHGSALAAATASALGASNGPSDPEDDRSRDGDDQDTSSMDHDAATARPSDYDRLDQVALELPA
uniref:Uncharacterized protein n=1 Tax=Peronospora matthiolae TaxID=2874970 RepID=A0AAV1T870_9STRA